MSALSQMLLASYGGSSGAGVFTPASLPGLQAWWDLSDTSTLTLVSGKISAVAGKAGGIDLTQATDSNRFAAGTHNGISAGIGSGNQTMNASSPLVLTSGAFWAFAVVRAESNAILLDGNGSGVNPYLFSPRASSVLCSLPDGDITMASAVGTFDATADLFVAVATASGLDLSFNDQSTTSGHNDGFTFSIVGGRASWRGIGALCEVFLGNGALSAGAITDAKSYLKTKWGTP